MYVCTYTHSYVCIHTYNTFTPQIKEKSQCINVILHWQVCDIKKYRTLIPIKKFHKFPRNVVEKFPQSQSVYKVATQL